MYFKFSSVNPFREFVRYAHRVATADATEDQRHKLYQDLWRVASTRLSETERLLNASPAFAERCAHWNQRDVASIRPMRNVRNPWLLFKREFESAVNKDSATTHREITIALAWLDYNMYKDDWIVG
jgi:hypothetical protein